MNSAGLASLSRAFGVPLNWEVMLAAALTLLPLLLAGFFQTRLSRAVDRLPERMRVLAPAVLCVPYMLVARGVGVLRLGWLALYALLPVAMAWMMLEARRADGSGRGDWRDFVVLALLGMAVDLRWFEKAWPPRFAVFNKMLLLDAGIYAFLLIRKLDGVGFTFRLRWSDVRVGVREFAWYTPIALALGLGLGFLHLHAVIPRVGTVALAYVFTFLFIAIPEELFFRGWMQNLLERRMGRTAALMTTSVIFGMAHFNKRAAHFNWRYVLLAALAGVFYGRAWRQERSVSASAITHACVDTVWSQWLR